jgi:hypothetical protein
MCVVLCLMVVIGVCFNQAFTHVELSRWRKSIREKMDRSENYFVGNFNRRAYSQ